MIAVINADVIVHECDGIVEADKWARRASEVLTSGRFYVAKLRWCNNTTGWEVHEIWQNGRRRMAKGAAA